MAGHTAHTHHDLECTPLKQTDRMHTSGEEKRTLCKVFLSGNFSLVALPASSVTVARPPGRLALSSLFPPEPLLALSLHRPGVPTGQSLSASEHLHAADTGSTPSHEMREEVNNGIEMCALDDV